MVLVIAPALDGLRGEWREAAMNLGASPAQYWRHVALPVLLPSLLGAGILLFGSSFGAYATAYALTSGQRPLVPLLIGSVTQGNVLSDPHYGDALALGMVLGAYGHDDGLRDLAAEGFSVAAMRRRRFLTLGWLWIALGAALLRAAPRCEPHLQSQDRARHLRDRRLQGTLPRPGLPG